MKKARKVGSRVKSKGRGDDLFVIVEVESKQAIESIDMSRYCLKRVADGSLFYNMPGYLLEAAR